MVYHPEGVCAKAMFLDVDEEGKIIEVSVIGGCEGNAAAVCRLIKDMPAREAIAKLEGITCGKKATSCPDQIAKALRQICGD